MAIPLSMMRVFPVGRYITLTLNINTMKKEKQINEVFDYEGVKLMCIEGDKCSRCYVYNKSLSCHNAPECREDHRKDKTGVVFVLADNQQQ